MKPPSCARSIRARMWTDFIRSMWPSWPWAIRPALFRAHRWACSVCSLRAKLEIAGAHVVVLGRSMIVGKPVALLLMQKGKGGDATVTVVHSRSRNLVEITRSADILIAAIGQPHFVKAEHVRDGAVVIDVGINRVDDASEGTRLPLGRGCRLSKVAQEKGDYAGAGRCRPDDDRDADVEHGEGLPAIDLKSRQGEGPRNTATERRGYRA